jgi:chaperonin cofactor prefoldin|tara:strand:- start:21 stop:248 length:228 start_codon:yes stop_codon:yes gene_type:complete
MLINKESQIKNLKENQELLEGKIKFLQDTCKRAGAQIKKLEAELKEATAWKEDEVEKFRNRLRDSAPYEKRLAND